MLYLSDWLVRWVSMGTGAGLTVFWGSSSGVSKEPRSTLLALLTNGVVLAALSTRTQKETSSVDSKHGVSQNIQKKSYIYYTLYRTDARIMTMVDAPYRAGASLWVAGVRMAVTLTQLTVAEVESSTCPGVAWSAVLKYATQKVVHTKILIEILLDNSIWTYHYMHCRTGHTWQDRPWYPGGQRHCSTSRARSWPV